MTVRNIGGRRPEPWGADVAYLASAVAHYIRHELLITHKSFIVRNGDVVRIEDRYPHSAKVDDYRSYF